MTPVFLVLSLLFSLSVIRSSTHMHKNHTTLPGRKCTILHKTWFLEQKLHSNCHHILNGVKK